MAPRWCSLLLPHSFLAHSLLRRLACFLLTSPHIWVFISSPMKLFNVSAHQGISLSVCTCVFTLEFCCVCIQLRARVWVSVCSLYVHILVVCQRVLINSWLQADNSVGSAATACIACAACTVWVVSMIEAQICLAQSFISPANQHVNLFLHLCKSNVT